MEEAAHPVQEQEAYSSSPGTRSDEALTKATAALRHKPDIARFISSRPGGFLLAVVQHAVWFARYRISKLRSLLWRPISSAPSPSPEPKEAAFSPAPEIATTAGRSTQPAEVDVAADPPPSNAGARAELARPSLSSVAFNESILHERPRILLDTTPTACWPNARGGIARVVTSLAEAGVKTGLALPVRIMDRALFPYYSHALMPGPVIPGRGDIYVIADVFWFSMPEYRPIVAQLRAAGVRIALVVHDIGAIRFPHLFREDMPELFRTGLLELLRQSNFCIGISRHVELDTRAWLDTIGFPSRRTLKFGHFLLGVGKTPIGDGELRGNLVDLFDGGRSFLSVGTIEPRKGYGVTLDACELAWLSGAAFVLVIIGRYGWSAEILRDRILAHPENGRRLFWIEDVTEAELAYAYAHCRCLIQSSLDEGFCLPVSEACLFGAAVIASDLPVLHEVAGSSIRYFSPGSHEELAGRINEALLELPAPACFPVRSWTESLRTLLDCLTGDDTVPTPLPMPAVSAAGRQPIHVACCFDDALAMPAGVLAASVAAATRDSPTVFHMIRAPRLTTDLTELRRTLETPQFTVVEHVAHGDTSHLYSNGVYSNAVYYRFLLPDLIDGNRVIYLDSDTMVRRSLSPLWELDLQTHPIAAAVDFLSLSYLNCDVLPMHYRGEMLTVSSYCQEVLGLDLAHTNYFNSGVMVMDLRAWRERNLAARCIAQCDQARELILVDQDATNQVLAGDFLRLDDRWNGFVYLPDFYKPRVGTDRSAILGGIERLFHPPSGEILTALRAAEDPWIAHFTYRSKPWRRDDWRTAFDAEWWEHAFRTPFGRLLYMTFLGTSEKSRNK